MLKNNQTATEAKAEVAACRKQRENKIDTFNQNAT